MTWQGLCDDARQRLLVWSLSGDTGVSSETIAAIAAGMTARRGSPFDFDIPYDSGDFGRCYRLLKAVPELRDALPRVAEVCPKWGPVVREWDRLTQLYEQDLAETPAFVEFSRGRGKPRGRVQVNQCACSDALQALRDECMAAAGFVKTGPCSWERRRQ